MLYDRILLASIIAGIWAVIRILEEVLPERINSLLPKPFGVYAILIFVVAMIVHVTWLTLAQRRRGFFHTRFEGSKINFESCANLPPVDIFVSLHNEENVIADTIENLLQINYPQYFIYLINDRSEDKTQEIIEKYERNFPQKIRVINISSDEIGGKSRALNHAFVKSESPLIAVFDADARVDSDFLHKMIPYLEENNIAGVQARKKISNYSTNYLTKLQENEYCMDSYYQCGKDVIQGNVEFRGNGQIVKRSALLDVGLWDEETLTDDLELSTRLTLNGWGIRFCPEAKVYEQGVLTWSALVKQRLRWCEGSLRRYLSNIYKIFGPSKAYNLTQRFDTLVFLCQFAVPVWIFLDIIAEIVRFITDQKTHVTFLMTSSFVIWAITWFSLVCGIRIYRKLTWHTSAIRAFETNMYFLTLWPTIVLLTFRKILFSRSVGKWHRTHHHKSDSKTQELAAVLK